MLIQGLFVAAITPFDDKGELDARGLRNNLRFLIREGVDGIVVLGTTAETPTLSEDEKDEVVEIALEEVKGKVHLTIGTGTYSTAETIENTMLAKEAGADSVLIVNPYYNRPTQEGLYLHFKAIIENVDIPVIVYNHPGRTGFHLQPETLQRIAQLPNICGLKDCSGQISYISDVVEQVSSKLPHFSMMSGDDNLILPIMALGGHGVISVLGNLIPGPIKLMINAAAQGDYATAREWHYKLMPLFRAAMMESNPIPLKAMMKLAGMPAGPCRLPLGELLPSNFQKIKNILEAHSSLWSNAISI